MFTYIIEHLIKYFILFVSIPATWNKSGFIKLAFQIFHIREAP